MDLLEYAFMQRALIAAAIVGLTAPAIGTYLVQRRQAVMGDGIGHVATTGVGLGFLLNTSPVWMASSSPSSARSAWSTSAPVAGPAATSRSPCSSTAAWPAAS